MQIRCYSCKMPISIGRHMVHQALQIVHEDDLVHFDFRCTKCKKANRISKEQLLHSAPGWEYVAEKKEKPVKEAESAPKPKKRATTAAKPKPKPKTKKKATTEEKPKPKPKTTPKPKSKPKSKPKPKPKPKSK
jgi:outer membrane biosynthesis protein TonB